jgi:hypothetical protein
MTTLSREYRRQLERVIIDARKLGEKGATNALKALAVELHEPLGGSNQTQRDLRNRLRAHGRQLGDKLDPKRGTQTIHHLASECAYEHWHRMLFARFLAENNLLIEPESGVALSLDECRELAREKNADWLELASSFAVRMLPQIFRQGDPVLEVSLPPETRKKLEELLEGLPAEVFAADDSLGWVYQFWQTEQKQRVNDSGEKIGADELPAVTQLFTEDYMVLFLLHNTLGAWWTAKRKAEGLDPALPSYEWTYLRLKEDGTPAAGSFDGWPRAARDLKVLDPCMGSGHFLVFALPILVGFRMEEEGLSREEAVKAVLRDNLFGLEIDPRCTQIAAFNLAFAAWRMCGGVTELPQLNLACSGLGINAKEEAWVKLAGGDGRTQETMRRLYHLFEQAPILGSLIDPSRIEGTLFSASFGQVRPLLETALGGERNDIVEGELAVAALGVVHAARILGDDYTLVVTNVPYLGRGKQVDSLKEYCDRFYTTARTDLATCMLQRCLSFCASGGTAALVITQYWLFLGTYKDLRQDLLKSKRWDLLAKLGPGAFDTISGEVVNVALAALSRNKPALNHRFCGLEAPRESNADQKSTVLRTSPFVSTSQLDQLKNPDARIILGEVSTLPLLGVFASTSQGLKTGDDLRFRRSFWEVSPIPERWRFYQTAASGQGLWDGMDGLVDWIDDGDSMARFQGSELWGKRGAAVAIMGNLYGSAYSGEIFDSSMSPIVPKDQAHLPAIQAFILSNTYRQAIRTLDSKVAVTTATLVKVPFDLPRWQAVAQAQFPSGLPIPSSADSSQWVFNGRPASSDSALDTAVARLIGYKWPRQTGSSFVDSPALGPDGLEKHADDDGIVCLASIQGEAPAADRLRALLADAYGAEWSGTKQAELLAQVGYAGKSLEDWLRDGFFEQHCNLFHNRPFVWHIGDGQRDGFHAFVNYHKLAAPNGDGRRTLEKLTYGYLGDWITRQRADQSNGVEGADARVAAAVHLQSELKKIIEGVPPYDIFIRWKPLHEQPIGWEPDINDGVRLNIRPFMAAKALNGRGKGASILRILPKGIKWDKDRGKEPHRSKEDFPWFWSWDGQSQDFKGGREFDGNRWNDLHYSIQAKKEARERQRETQSRQVTKK